MGRMDPIAFHSIVQLVRKGVYDVTDIEEMARRLEDEGEADAAHAVRATLVEAYGEQPVEERRAAMVLVPRIKLGPDGGNRE